MGNENNENRLANMVVVREVNFCTEEGNDGWVDKGGMGGERHTRKFL